RKREEQLLAACLDAGQSFVVDNTNPQASDRAKYIGSARAKGFRVVAYFFDVPLRDAMHRNNQRKLRQKIPAVAVAGTHKKLERPRKAEGFDQIFTVRVTEPSGFVVTEGA
ncbi:MAG TPA: AAA family ATPase, partial [Candidatus Dormibacteraeota bacterium]|nr:AAA family ATPase [Candidatus Dormibacteraeota bacterium]